MTKRGNSLSTSVVLTGVSWANRTARFSITEAAGDFNRFRPFARMGSNEELVK